MKLDTVKRNFSRAASTYDTHAGIQKKAASELVSLLAECLESAPSNILEAGCGTGLLTGDLARAYPGSSITATDISPHMVEYCRQKVSSRKVSFLQCDGRTLQPDNNVDLVVAGMTIQWFDTIREVLNQWRGTTSRALGFSLPVEGTFSSAAKTLRERTGLSPFLPFVSAATVHSWCRSLSGEPEVFLRQYRYYQYFPSMFQFLKTLKHTGTHYASVPHQPASMREVSRLQEEVEIEWEIVYCVVL